MWRAGSTPGPSTLTPRWPAIEGLDSGPGFQAQVSFHFTLPMGQQTNKHIKKKRRIAYHKRRNARLKAAVKTKK